MQLNTVDIVPGDWFQTATGCSHCCFMRMLPGGPLVSGRLPAGTFLGPVHAIDVNEKYVAVLVPYVRTNYGTRCHPSFEPPNLAWVSVRCTGNQEGGTRLVHFAHKIQPWIVRAWRARGWENQFLGEANEFPVYGEEDEARTYEDDGKRNRAHAYL